MMILNNAVITTAGTFTGPLYQLREPAGHGPTMFLEFQETFTFGSGAAVTADVYIQTSFSNNTTRTLAPCLSKRKFTTSPNARALS